jgi:hypothetical protein
MTDLIHDIEAFLGRHAMSQSQFGLLALNDKPFVSQIKAGRRVWPETAARVRAWIAKYEAEKAASKGEAA